METMGKYILGQEDHSPRSSSGGSFSIEKFRMLDITRDKPIKVAVRVAVPVRDHPKFNFVGKLLGPKGNSLKRLQEDTMCKMAVLGRGSMKDRKKEEELRLTGDSRYSHLGEDLHVEISTFAPPAEAHARIAYALAEVRRFLVPDYHDDIRQEQMWEMQALTTTNNNQNSDSSTPENGILSDTDSADGGILNGYIQNNNQHNSNNNIANSILNGVVSGLNCLNNNNNNNNNNSNNNINNNGNHNSINHSNNNNNNNNISNNGHVNGNENLNNLNNTLNFVNNCDLNGNDMQIDLIGSSNANILGNGNSLTAATGGLLHNHPALRGIKAISIAGGLGRKRPLFSLPRTGMNSTKRTVMTLLARAKSAQALHGSPRTTIIDPTTAVQLLTSPIILQQTPQLDPTNILQHNNNNNNNNISSAVVQVSPTMTSTSTSASTLSVPVAANNGQGLVSQGGVISTLIS